MSSPLKITPELILKAYAAGIFPMAEDENDTTLYWVEPKMRGLIPLETFHVSKRLARTIRSDRYRIRSDTDFAAVIAGCAEARRPGERTWINEQLRQLYGELFRLGHCHTIEVYREEKLVGGLYGIALGAAFFGESMFHYERDTSKIALAHLVARLRHGGFRLLDAQFLTQHLAQFGAVEIPQRSYKKLLAKALESPATWTQDAEMPASGREIVAALTVTD